MDDGGFVTPLSLSLSLLLLYLWAVDCSRTGRFFTAGEIPRQRERERGRLKEIKSYGLVARDEQSISFSSWVCGQILTPYPFSDSQAGCLTAMSSKTANAVGETFSR